MKIGILTLPLHHNYGGIVQTFALLSILKELGHEPVFINRQDNKLPLWKFILSIMKRLFLKYILFKKDIFVFEDNRIKMYFFRINTFINKHIQPQTKLYRKENDIKMVNLYNFDAYIVGSDQVWRADYYKKWKMNFFFDFVKAPNAKKISYAASFGTDTWNYDVPTTQKIKSLLNEFSAVSVRERSAAELINKYLNIEAVHVLDPTMLLKKEDYIKIIEAEGLKNINGELFAYILDNNDFKEGIIRQIEKMYSYKSYTIYDDNSLKSTTQINYVLPSVYQWLECFNKAKFVITDSFHGCAFAIIFNLPFFVVANEYRGNTRFTSLLEIFQLQNRLLYENIKEDEIKKIKPIDWLFVNNKREEIKKESINYLIQALKNE